VDSDFKSGYIDGKSRRIAAVADDSQRRMPRHRQWAFAAVARVTPERWGLPRGERRDQFRGSSQAANLKIETTICHEVAARHAMRS